MGMMLARHRKEREEARVRDAEEEIKEFVAPAAEEVEPEVVEKPATSSKKKS